MKKLVMMLAGIGIAASAVPVAANAAPRMDRRQVNIEARIDQGIRTGRITKREAYRFKMEARSIARLESRYRYSGHRFTTWERRDIDRRLNTLSAQVDRAKHDRPVYRRR